MKVHILGSGGWFPTSKRETCSTLIEYKNTAIFIDAGSGLTRLREIADLLEKFHNFHFIFTHYHHDHISGIPSIPCFFENKKINIWGPGKPWYPEGCRAYLKRLIGFPFFSLDLEGIAATVEIRDYDEKGFWINDLQVFVNLQKHSDPTFGLSFGDYLHFATDTEPLEESFQRASKCKALFHECWGIKGNYPGHTSAEEILSGIKGIKKQAVYLMHIPPFWKQEEEDELMAYLKDNKQLVVLEDKMVINI